MYKPFIGLLINFIGFNATESAILLAIKLLQKAAENNPAVFKKNTFFIARGRKMI